MSVFNQYAQYYDIYYEGKDYKGECDFIEAAFTRFGQRPRAILDLAGGTGNHGLQLAARGYQVYGVDRSAAMLAQYQQKAEERGLEVELREQDLRQLELGQQFDAAICMFDAIDYLPENADLRTFLHRVHSHLQPGGLFLFDFWHAAPVLCSHDPVRVREFMLNDGNKNSGRLLRISTTTLDITRQIANVEFRVLAFEGERLAAEFSEVHSMRYFLSQEMAFILEATGWQVLHLCPAFELDETINTNTWHLVALATPRPNGKSASTE